MHDKAGKLSYHLVFASQHYRGLEKMKEAMEQVDQSGSYCFSDAETNNLQLRYDFHDPDSFADRLLDELGGKPRPYSEFRDYALNETPFLNPKAMLRVLKERGLVSVEWLGSPPKQGFPEDRILSIKLGRQQAPPHESLGMALPFEDHTTRTRHDLPPP